VHSAAAAVPRPAEARQLTGLAGTTARSPGFLQHYPKAPSMSLPDPAAPLPQVNAAYLPDDAPVMITIGQLRNLAEEAAVKALERIGFKDDDESRRDVWVIRIIAKLARLWTWRMTMVAMGLFFIIVASVCGGYVRKWIG
jgi:hypothetical protein